MFAPKHYCLVLLFILRIRLFIHSSVAQVPLFIHSSAIRNRLFIHSFAIPYLFLAQTSKIEAIRPASHSTIKFASNAKAQRLSAKEAE